MKYKKFEEYEIAWIKEHAKDYKLQELADKFYVTKAVMRNLLNRENIHWKNKRITKKEQFTIDFMETEARHMTLKEMAERLNTSQQRINNALSSTMLPFLSDSTERIPEHQRVDRKVNMIKLSVGDYIKVIDLVGQEETKEQFTATVIANYGYFYLLEKDNGVKTTIHKVDETVNIAILRRGKVEQSREKKKGS